MHDEALGISRFPKSYRFVRTIARGGTAVAFEVVHLPTGERRVAKLLPDAALADPSLAQRMQREARILRRLRHPNVVRVLDWGRLERGKPFLVLEYLDGATVADEVRRRTITVDEALTWTSQVLSALGAAHAAGLIHRDVSPDNLLVCGAPEARCIKVCDFGFAKVVDEERAEISAGHETDDYAVVGSPYYISPEAVRAEPLDARSDLYQVGLVLYTMLTGYVPFSEFGDTVSVLGARLHTELPPVAELRGESVPPELETTLKKALSTFPSDRFVTAQEFMAALAGLRSGPTHATATWCETFGAEELQPASPGGARDGLDAHDERQDVAVEASVARWLDGLEPGGESAR